MGMFIIFIIWNSDSSTGWQLLEWRERNQRMLQALLLPPAVHVHRGMPWVDRVAQRLPNGLQGPGLKCWVGTKWSEAKKQKYCEQRFGRNLQKKPQNGPEWSLFWGISLGTSSLQSIPHPIYAYTFCSQQASAVGGFCHLLLSQTSEVLPILTVVGHSQVSHWCLAFLCVAGEEEAAVINPLMRRLCCGDNAARKGLKCWNWRLRSRERGARLWERGRGQQWSNKRWSNKQWSNKRWSRKDFAQSTKGNFAGSFLPPCKRGTSRQASRQSDRAARTGNSIKNAQYSIYLKK